MNLAMQLVAAAERRGGAEAVVEGESRLSYTALAAQAQAVAAGLAQLGVVPGDRVAVALRNRVETVVLYWATQWLGACFVPINWRLTPDNVAYCVHDAEAKVLAVEEVTVPVAGRVGAQAQLIGLAGADVGVDFGALADAAGRPEPAAPGDDHPALMLYTSGTTGRPKGVPRSAQAEWSAALAQVIQCRYEPGERTLGVMPLYHTMGMRSLLAMTAVDGCLVAQPAFRAAEALQAVQDERISALYLAPTFFHDLVQAAAERPGATPAVARLAYAGAPMTAALVRACRDLFSPAVFVNHYGSTEVYTFSVHADQDAKPGCAGRAGIHSRLRLVGASPDAHPAQPVAEGQVGQVACHLSSIEAFSGYWKRPDADARAIRDGWYLTGDLGRLDQDGDLWLLGRVDDMIITGGENVYPQEVEEALVTHPSVREVAVVGLPDPRLGERVVAFVVGEGADPAALEAYCLASPDLASFKRPRDYHFVAALPKNASGKLLRYELKKAGLERAGSDIAEERPKP